MEVTAEMAGVAIAAITATAGASAFVASLLVKNQVLEAFANLRVEIQQGQVKAEAAHAQHEITKHQVSELKETVNDHEERIRALEEKQ